MSEITVFISYSHDSPDHREKVLALSERLRKDRIETRLDQYLNGAPPEGWPRRMLNQLDAANFVLVVCTETYYRRFRGHEAPGKGKGVDWEGTLITQEIYDRRSTTLKFVPVLFPSADEPFIPEPLRAGTHCSSPSTRIRSCGNTRQAIAYATTRPRPQSRRHHARSSRGRCKLPLRVLHSKISRCPRKLERNPAEKGYT